MAIDDGESAAERAKLGSDHLTAGRVRNRRAISRRCERQLVRREPFSVHVRSGVGSCSSLPISPDVRFRALNPLTRRTATGRAPQLGLRRRRAGMLRIAVGRRPMARRPTRQRASGTHVGQEQSSRKGCYPVRSFTCGRALADRPAHYRRSRVQRVDLTSMSPLLLPRHVRP